MPKENSKIVTLIPARAGSKGVPGKNIKLLGGYPLIAYSIIASKLCKSIDRTIVSTDSHEIAKIAKKYGAEVPFLRPAEFARDASTDIEFVLHTLNWFSENEGEVPEYLVHLRPTTPLRSPEIIDAAIKEIGKNREATSLRSGHPASESPYKWFLKGADGYFKGILPEYSIDYTNNPRQSFPEVYIPDGYVDVYRTEFIQKHQRLLGDRVIAFISPVCVELDTMEDFKFLEFELKEEGSLILDYLKNNFSRKD